MIVKDKYKHISYWNFVIPLIWGSFSALYNKHFNGKVFPFPRIYWLIIILQFILLYITAMFIFRYFDYLPNKSSGGFYNLNYPLNISGLFVGFAWFPIAWVGWVIYRTDFIQRFVK